MTLEGTVRRSMDRRAFLLGAIGATAAGVLAACSQPSQPAATAVSPAAAASPAAKPAASPAAAASPSPVAGGGTYTLQNPPAVANAAAARAFSSQRITYYGDGVGLGNDIDKALANRFTQDTGIQINVIPRPQSATDTFAQYQRFFQGQ